MLTHLADGQDFIVGDPDGEDLELVITFSGEDRLTRQCVNYTIIDNNVPELMEDFLIILNSPLQGVDFQPSEMIQAIILDDDGIQSNVKSKVM